MINLGDILFHIINAIYLILTGNLANWWWNWENKPDYYPKNFFVHLVIWGFICTFPALLYIVN